jgi:hypothetical protein
MGMVIMGTVMMDAVTTDGDVSRIANWRCDCKDTK